MRAPRAARRAPTPRARGSPRLRRAGSRCASRRRAGSRAPGVSLSGDSADSRQKPADADRADHRIEAAGEHAVDVAAADELHRRCRSPVRRTRTPCAPRSHSRGCRGGASAAPGLRPPGCGRTPAGRWPSTSVRQAVGVELAGGRARAGASARDRRSRAHHAGADRATPAMAVLAPWTDTCVDAAPARPLRARSGASGS